MSTSTLMNLIVQAMFAAQTQLNVTGHNIANAAVPGYSRQTARLSTAPGQATGAGYIGRGVSVDTVERAVNRFLTSQVAQTRSQSAADETRSDMLSQLEDSFPLGSDGLGQAVTDLGNAFADLATSPRDESMRVVVLGKAGELASRLRATGSRIEQIQEEVGTQIADEVDVVNGLTRQIATLNQQVMRAAGGGHAPNDLLDQRDQLINELSQHIEVSRVDQAGPGGSTVGMVSLFVAGGQALVLGDANRELSASVDDDFPQQVRLLIASDGAARELPAGMVGSGVIGGLLAFQADDLNAARNQLGQLAAGYADALNQQHAQGTDMTGQAGQSLLSVGAAQVAPAAGNARDASGQFATTVQITRVAGHGAQLQASDYALQQDPADPASYQITRLADGKVFAGLASGAEVDGFRFDVSAAPMAASDRFVLRPVAGAAVDTAVAIGDPRRLAAAGAAAAGTGNANALQLRALGTSKVIDGKTFTDAHARVLADLGVRVQRATSDADASASVAKMTREQLGSETGVNLEEEAAKLIQYQQSYQAAAKVLTTAQRLFDTLLSVVE